MAEVEVVVQEAAEAPAEAEEAVQEAAEVAPAAEEVVPEEVQEAAVQAGDPRLALLQ